MRHFFQSLFVGVTLIILVTACGKVAMIGVPDDISEHTDDEDFLLIDTLTESDDVFILDEDIPETEISFPDEDFMSEHGGCGSISEPEPVETDYTVRLTRQWGAESSKGFESGNAVAFDFSGSVYIAGSTDASFNCHQNTGETDNILLKMAHDGTLIWSRQWGTVEDDWPTAIAVDMQGDIFVAGVTGGSLGDGFSFAGGYKDLFVSKWTSDGIELWTKQWGSDYSDFVLDITLDKNGNLILTGDAGNDMLLAKWDNDGNEIWTVQWGENGNNRSYAVALAPDGDIFVAGNTSGELDGNINAGGKCSCFEFPFGSGQVACSSCKDIFLSRFTSEGVRLSTVQWGLNNSDDTVRGLYITQDGNIFVAGTTGGAFDGTINEGGDCGYNYCSDVFLSRLDSTGNIIWTRQNGLSGDDVFGGLDSDGSSIIVANGAMLYKYDIDGNELWTSNIGKSFPKDLTISVDGTIALTGYEINNAESNHDMFIGLWDNTGVTEWNTLLSGNKAEDQLKALTVSPDGTLFMAGNTDGAFTGNKPEGKTDLFLAKSNDEGVLYWIKQAGTVEHEEVSAVAVDKYGNIYTTGYTYGLIEGVSNAGGADIYLMKQNAVGTEQWVRQWGKGYDDAGYAVAVDADGNVYVTGFMDGSLKQERGHVFLTKMTASGIMLWTEEWGSYPSSSVAYGVAVDSTGNIFVTGEVLGGIDGNTNKGDGCVEIIEVRHGGLASRNIPCTDGFLTKFTSNGVKEWTTQWGTENMDAGRTIKIGSDGFVYLAGSTGDYTVDGFFEGVRQAFAAKWSSDGENVWTEIWGSEKQTDVLSLALNMNGDIFVTGYTLGSLDGALPALGGGDVFLIKMNNSGARLWAEQWGSVLDDYGNAVEVGPDGRIFVAGHTYSAFDGNLNRGGTDVFLSILEEK